MLRRLVDLGWAQTPRISLIVLCLCHSSCAFFIHHPSSFFFTVWPKSLRLADAFSVSTMSEELSYSGASYPSPTSPTRMDGIDKSQLSHTATYLRHVI